MHSGNAVDCINIASFHIFLLAFQTFVNTKSWNLCGGSWTHVIVPSLIIFWCFYMFLQRLWWNCTNSPQSHCKLKTKWNDAKNSFLTLHSVHFCQVSLEMKCLVNGMWTFCYFILCKSNDEETDFARAYGTLWYWN